MRRTEIAYFILALFIGLFVPWWIAPLKGAQIEGAVILLVASLLAMLRVVGDSWLSVVIAGLMFMVDAVVAVLVVYALNLQGISDVKTILVAVVWAVLSYASAVLARRAVRRMESLPHPMDQ